MRTLRESVTSAKGIVFDLYHTLTARESGWSAGPLTYQMLGVTLEQWERQLFETSRFRLAGEERDPFQIVSRMAHAINPRLDEQIIRAATESRVHRFERALCNIPPENIRLLTALRARGIKLGLVSNADAMETAGWSRSPLAPFFHSTVFSCDVGHVKPEPEIFLHCLKELQLKSPECLFVGDGGSNELLAARQLGFITVMVAGVIRDIWPDRIEARAKDADYLIEHPIEMLPSDWVA